LSRHADVEKHSTVFLVGCNTPNWFRKPFTLRVIHT